jgi:hypothetical protein
MYSILSMAQRMPKGMERYRGMLLCIWYTCTICHSHKRRTLMDVPSMVDGWHRAIKAMATGHDKDTVDHGEFAMEELMGPLLTAPVRQLRQFWTALEAALKADPAIPFIIWRLFEGYGTIVVKPAKDQAIIELKTALAREVAQLVEQEVQPDIMEAIVAALKWRDPETLEAIRNEVKRGTNPRLKGGESCLFLVVGEHKVML